MRSHDNYILEVLQDASCITASQAAGAKAGEFANGNAHLSPVEGLVRAGIVAQEEVSRALAAALSMEFVDLGGIVVKPEITDLLSKEHARRFRVVPVGINDEALVIATGDPLNFDTLDSLRHLLPHREIELVVATPEQIAEALIKYYGSADEASENILRGLGEDIDLSSFEVTSVADADADDTGDSAIIRLVSLLLLEAYKARASDIHLEPLEKKFRVRFRIDGVLQEMQNPPKKLQSAIISRLKIMSGTMSIAEKRLPQDGRIQVLMGKKSIDLRVSTIPTNHGESVVMRILDKSSLALGLPELGFLTDDQATFERLITLPDGILLVTGPTGSGKTTTLYACLHHINKPDRKIITVEDPVEYQMAGINQVQVNPEIGMTFPAALRSMLRQAPNIIMIGEIRDLETASIAINASLTGHLVFSTLHTNDSPSAVARSGGHGREAVSRRHVHPRDHGAAARAPALRAVQDAGGAKRRRAARVASGVRSAARHARHARRRLRGLPRARVSRADGNFRDLRGGRRSAVHDQRQAFHVAITPPRPRAWHADLARGWRAQGALRCDNRRGSPHGYDGRCGLKRAFG